eukprot:5473268-Karenia_brevis.AAC.1
MQQMVGKAVGELNSNLTTCFKDIMDEQQRAYEGRFRAVEGQVAQLNTTVAGHQTALAAQASQNTQFFEAIAALQAQCNTLAGQLAAVQATVAQQKVLQDKAQTEAKEYASTVTQLSQQLAIDSSTAIQDPSYDRAPNWGMLRLGSAKPVDKQAIQDMCDAWLGSSLAENSWKLEGPPSGTKFSIVFVGPTGTPPRLASKANSILRRGDGSWQALYAGEERIFVNRDASPKQGRIQATLRKLQSVLFDLDPSLRGQVRQLKPTYGKTPMDGYVRVKGMLAIRITAELEAEDPEITFDNDVLAKLGLQKGAILDGYSEKLGAAASSANVMWCK